MRALRYLFPPLLALLAVAACAGDGSTPAPGDEPTPPDPVPVDPTLLSEDLVEFQERFSAELTLSQDWVYEDLVARYPLAEQVGALGYDPTAAAFFDEIVSTFQLPQAVVDKVAEQGFAVSAQNEWYTHGWAYEHIYVAELPVLITTDSVLHALHRSFDELLMVTEEQVLRSRLQEMLARTHEALGELGADGDLADAARDADLYLTMARSLLAGAPVATLAGGDLDAQVTALMEAVAEQRMEPVEIFGATRKIDFSQFEPRGHYEETETLQTYFRSMMWLGRIDFRLREYDPFTGAFLWRDRQIRASWLLHQALHSGDAFAAWKQVSDLIGTLVGPPDSMTFEGWSSLAADALIEGPADLQGDLSALHAVIEAGRYGNQRINSHWLTTNPLSAEVTPLPLSFTVMGQRFVVDSHVFANVVYDRIVHQETKVMRALPQPLDAMFVLGANHALPLLQDELEGYPYAGNLHALRYLVDDYDETFWSENVYNLWLTAIRGLNTLPEGAVPGPMTTEAWSHKTLNTQLGSWAELRHDTLLYAKQSYTGGVGCEYPDGYVEPYPATWAALGQIATRIEVELGGLPFAEQWTGERVAQWASTWRSTMKSLGEITNAQLADEPLTEEQTLLIKSWLKLPEQGVCGGPSFTGIYPQLFFNEMHAEEADPTVADVHTNPNADGPMAPPRVLHVGTGWVNLMVLTRESCEGTKAYVGPVGSYYEIVEMGLDRLTDSEWTERLAQPEPPARPAWTSSFLVE